MALVLVLPTLLIVGLTARRPLPRPNSKTQVEAGQVIWESDQLSEKHKIRSVLLRSTGDQSVIQLLLEPLDDVSAPDLLVYWSPELTGRDNLPANAVLLGVFEKGKPLRLQESNAKGVLILYSLGYQSIVDAAPLESVL